ncbi:MAG: AraC family transcriptional regulator [Nannocystales bacterium]
MSDRPRPGRIDAVGEALHHLRMSGAFYCRSTFTAPYGVDMPPLEGTLMFHVVTQGHCWIEVPEHPLRCLQPGDLALVPHGLGHRLLSESGQPSVDFFSLDVQKLSDRYEQVEHGGGGQETTMLCGAVRLDHPVASKFVSMLPNLIHIDAWSDAESHWMQSTLRFLADEAKSLRPGGETIITRLCDIIVVQAVRSWLSTAPEANAGWLGALRDERIGRAILHIHREPEREVGLEELAKEAGMSRSAFSARFSELLGEPPVRYATRWRMAVAHSWLREDDASIAEVAGKLGYQSEAAFSRAFKRMTGRSPSAARSLP